MTNRRNFIKGVAGTVSGVVATAGLGINQAAVAQQTTATAPTEKASALPPSHYESSMETGAIPEGYTEDQAHHYFVQSPGSDFMIDVIKGLGIDYIASNPGSSFRGFQESVSVYGGNKKPEFLTCLHEESAAAMAHGYAKIANKPMGIAVHGTVGLQHAAMGIYNAYCDRAPIMIFAGNHMDANDRRPGAEWSHSALDCVKLVRDFIKWDDIPLSLPHYLESTQRAYKVATTPPMGPVAIVVDGHLQEEDTHGNVPKIPHYTPSTPPHGDMGALTEAARILANAENPVILAGRAARTPVGLDHMIALAEALQAPVSGDGRMNFPNTHYLHQGGRQLIRQADVILGLENRDLWGQVNTSRDLVHRVSSRVARDDVKLISIGSDDLYMLSNYQNFQRFQPVDLDINGDAEASLPFLIEEIKRQMPRARRDKLKARAEKLRESYQKGQEDERIAAVLGWDDSPVSLYRLSLELYDVVKDRDWSFVSQKPSGLNFWPMTRHYHHIGGSGGAGIGYELPASVGAALANREHGRFSVAIQPDGDFLFAPGVVWTAAHHRIPILWVMHNNRAYHQEVMHLQRMASRRQRGNSNHAKIGNVFEDPFINFAKLADGFGVYSEGPITRPEDLAPALKRAAAIVDSGMPALVDVVCQPA
jgi:acetolactate synthase I/II/III large subunit